MARTRFQVFARVNDIVNGLGVTLKADLPDDDLTIDSLGPGLRRCQLARA